MISDIESIKDIENKLKKTIKDKFLGVTYKYDYDTHVFYLLLIYNVQTHIFSLYPFVLHKEKKNNKHTIEVYPICDGNIIQIAKVIHSYKVEFDGFLTKESYNDNDFIKDIVSYARNIENKL